MISAKVFGRKSKVGRVVESQASVDELIGLHQRTRQMADFEGRASLMNLGFDFFQVLSVFFKLNAMLFFHVVYDIGINLLDEFISLGQ